MINNFFDNIDVDLNHFDDLYHNLFQNSDNQYYDVERFNNSFSVECSRDLSVAHLNIASLSKNGPDLIAYLSLLNRKFDAICLSETNVADIQLAKDLFDDYESFHSIRGCLFFIPQQL